MSEDVEYFEFDFQYENQTIFVLSSELNSKYGDAPIFAKMTKNEAGEDDMEVIVPVNKEEYEKLYSAYELEISKYLNVNGGNK